MPIEVSNAYGQVPITILKVIGNLDSYTFREFEVKADEIVEGGARHVLVDFTDAPYVSSAGFRALHQLFNLLRGKNPESDLPDDEVRKGISAGTYMSPHLKLLNLSPESRKAFEMTGFDMYIETFNDLKTAIAAFQA